MCLQESRQPYDLEASFTNCVSEKLYRREPCHPPREEGRKKGEEEGNKEKEEEKKEEDLFLRKVCQLKYLQLLPNFLKNI